MVSSSLWGGACNGDAGFEGLWVLRWESVTLMRGRGWTAAMAGQDADH